MSNEYFNAPVYRILCGKFGNAFLIAENILVTVRHVVENNQKKDKPKKITLKFVESGKETTTDCDIVSHDEQEFKNSSLVLIKTKKPLPIPPSMGIHTGGIDGLQLEIHSHRLYEGSDEYEPEIVTHHHTSNTKSCPNTHEAVTHTLKSDRKNYEGDSGAPIINNDCLVGILVGQNAEDGEARHAFALCGNKFFELLERCKKRLSQEDFPIEESLVNKDEPAIKTAVGFASIEPSPFTSEAQTPEVLEIKLSYEEELARSCCDNPEGFGDIMAYFYRLKGTEKLQNFAISLVEASMVTEEFDIENCMETSYNNLKEVYPDPKQFEDVYFAALYSLFYGAYTTENLSLDNVIRAISIRTPKSIGQNCVLALCYSAKAEYDKTRIHLDEACKLLDGDYRSYHTGIFLLCALLPSKSGDPIPAHIAICYLQKICEKFKDPAAHKGFAAIMARAHRTIARYYSNSGLFDKPMVIDPLDELEQAYSYDLSDPAAEDYLAEDDKYLLGVCENAYRFYTNNPDGWKKFINKAYDVLDKSGRDRVVLSRISMESEYHFEHLRIEHLIRTGNYVTDLRLSVRRNYPEDRLVDNAPLSIILHNCSVNNKHLLKITNIQCDARDEFIMRCSDHHVSFLTSCPDGFSVKPLEPIPNVITPTQFLFSYLYSANGIKPILVWQMFIWEKEKTGCCANSVE